MVPIIGPGNSSDLRSPVVPIIGPGNTKSCGAHNRAGHGVEGFLNRSIRGVICLCSDAFHDSMF